jgi:hypothetical protein
LRTLLIDADSEAFAASAAAETIRYVGHLDDGTFIGPVEGMKALNALVPEGRQCVPYKQKEVRPIEQAQIFFDARIRRVVDAAEGKWGSLKVELYISGKINYRHLIDPTYKWSRDRNERPYHLHAIRQHAIDQWGARVCPTWEADDEIGMRATELGEGGYIVSSLDKDLRQIPGDHLVLEQSGVKGYLLVSPRGGALRMYAQTLAGDPTDNVPGCWRIGYDTAFTLLEPVVDSGPAAMWAKVLEVYEASLVKYGRDTCGYIDARAQALRTAQMVYILRHRPDGPIPPRWHPPIVHAGREA